MNINELSISSLFAVVGNVSLSLLFLAPLSLLHDRKVCSLLSLRVQRVQAGRLDISILQSRKVSTNILTVHAASSRTPEAIYSRIWRMSKELLGRGSRRRMNHDFTNIYNTERDRSYRVTSGCNITSQQHVIDFVTNTFVFCVCVCVFFLRNQLYPCRDQQKKGEHEPLGECKRRR
jgi:hypothetical protein